MTRKQKKYSQSHKLTTQINPNVFILIKMLTKILD